ncbi:btk-binding protein-related [Anaeramoeba flamelloides]|uniref:Btk-binding protein-related n=1 Tax=Anaeramoeba flamelloides TaxID=1746091 RepID=A0ABQ8XZM7_9EUKA|nr:btk-binding protein-related [Anaeramoeba flamelloides]
MENIYACGDNSGNILGIKNMNSPQVKPERITVLKGSQIKLIGASHSQLAILSEDNKLYKSRRNTSQPEIDDKSENLVEIKAGFESLYYRYKDNLIIIDNNGRKTKTNYFVNKGKIKKIIDGIFALRVLMENGDLWECTNLTNPQIFSKKSSGVIDVWGGLYAYQYFYKTKTQFFGEGSWIGNGNGEKTLTDFKPEQIIQCAAGYENSWILYSEDNNTSVYATGSSFSGAGNSTNIAFYKKIQELSGIGVEKLWSGCYHLFARTSGGSIYTCGRNSSGECGTGKIGEIKKPVQLKGEFLENIGSVDICVGSFFTVFYPKKNSILTEDLLSFYKSGKLTDFRIKENECHKLFLELRTSKKAQDVKKVLENHKDEEVKDFLNWIYSGISKKNSILKEILEQCGLTEEEIKNHDGIKNVYKDFNTLYQDEDSKDFNIIVKIDDEDEEEEEFEEIPVHKLILAVRSGLFREMFSTLQEEEDSVQDFSNKSIESIECVIRYLYTCKIELTADDDIVLMLEELEDAVEYYQLNPRSDLFNQLKKYQKSMRK